jgi:hypothetical protein
MSAQALELHHGIRIKFASLRDDGRLEPDCHEEYTFFPHEAPAGWRVMHEGHIETRHDHTRDSWVFSDGTHEVAAVEHETGIEILIAVNVNVGSAAIVGFATWAWARWKHARGPKPMPTLVVEKIEDRLPDGTERRVKRITVKGDVNAKEINDILTSL